MIIIFIYFLFKLLCR